MPATLVIGNKNYSSWSLRPWLLLRHFGVPFDEVRLPLDTPDYAMVDDGPDWLTGGTWGPEGGAAGAAGMLGANRTPKGRMLFPKSCCS